MFQIFNHLILTLLVICVILILSSDSVNAICYDNICEKVYDGNLFI